MCLSVGIFYLCNYNTVWYLITFKLSSSRKVEQFWSSLSLLLVFGQSRSRVRNARSMLSRLTEHELTVRQVVHNLRVLSTAGRWILGRWDCSSVRRPKFQKIVETLLDVYKCDTAYYLTIFALKFSFTFFCQPPCHRRITALLCMCIAGMIGKNEKFGNWFTSF